ncbi:MAG: hypothetical protein AAGC92_10305 [Pseudomonadota bacterium]
MDNTLQRLKPDAAGVIARLPCSPARRVLATMFLAFPGIVLLWLAVSRGEASLLTTIITTVVGLAMVWGAWQVWTATQGGLVLTETGLYDQDGRTICPLREIERVESGILALKPSGGFVLHLANAAPAGWVPGLWWRRGKRLGIGGSVNARMAKTMSEAIAMLVLRRNNHERGE